MNDLQCYCFVLIFIRQVQPILLSTLGYTLFLVLSLLEVSWPLLVLEWLVLFKPAI